MQEEIRPLWSVIRNEIGVDDRPQRAASHLLHRLGVEYPPVPIESLAKRLNVKLVKNPRLRADGLTMAGVLHSTRSEATIWVNGADQGVRQRFTIAHELGHLMLHTIGTQYRDQAFGPSTDRKENQANEFAAALLIPLWMLEPIVVGSRKTQRELADLFDVSMPAIGIQLKKLLS